MTDEARLLVETEAWIPLGNGVEVNPQVFFKAMWAAMDTPYIVAEFECSKQFEDGGELMEIAALHVGPSAEVLHEFNVLIRIGGEIGDFSFWDAAQEKANLERNGVPLTEALTAFDAFCQTGPVFVHHADFIQPFLQQAYAKVGKVCEHTLHDTLLFDPCIWNFEGEPSLANIAMHVGKPLAGTRLLDEAYAILNVLLAAREESARIADDISHRLTLQKQRSSLEQTVR